MVASRAVTRPRARRLTRGDRLRKWMSRHKHHPDATWRHLQAAESRGPTGSKGFSQVPGSRHHQPMSGWDWTAIGVVAATLLGLITLWQARAHKRQTERREDVALAEQQQLREKEEAAKRGRPSTAPAVVRLPGGSRTYEFRVTNVGGQALLDLEPFLIDDTGVVCSEPLPSAYLDPLHPKDSLTFALTVRDDAIDRNPLRLHYKYLSWDTHLEHTSGVVVPRE